MVPDNLNSGVTKPCRYEPGVNRTYEEMAAHYGVAVVPARPLKPKDKAKVEGGVLIVERWILAALRKRNSSRSAKPIRPSASCSRGSTSGASVNAKARARAFTNSSTSLR